MSSRKKGRLKDTVTTIRDNANRMRDNGYENAAQAADKLADKLEEEHGAI